MTADELAALADEVGLDVVGAARAAPYDEAEGHIEERRARGLFADMRFTMARPEVSCHPAALLGGARSVVAGALCYYRDGSELGPDEGRLPRYTWSDEYAVLRERLEELGRFVGLVRSGCAQEPRGGRLARWRQSDGRDAFGRRGA